MSKVPALSANRKTRPIYLPVDVFKFNSRMVTQTVTIYGYPEDRRGLCIEVF